MEITFLAGDITAESGPAAETFSAAIHDCLSDRPRVVFDLETGTDTVGVGAERLGVEIGREGLSPLAGRIILSGLLFTTAFGWRGSVYGASNNLSEAEILAQTLELITSVLADGGELIGHNVAGFDLPFLARRAKVAGLRLPGWLVDATSSWDLGGVQDTYRHFEMKRFVQTGIALGDLVDIWGRPFQSFGATFGEQWDTKPGRRELLVAYNVWNLMDNAALSVFLGSGTKPRSEFVTGTPSRVLPFESAKDYVSQPTAALPLPPRSNRKRPPVIIPLCAPRADLFVEGPSKRKGWGRASEQSKMFYPWTNKGALDARASRLVGVVIESTDGVEVVFHPDDEVLVLQRSLATIKRFKQDGTALFCSDAVQLENFFRLRLSAYAGLVPKTTFMNLHSWPDALFLDSWVRSLTANPVELTSPTPFLGEDDPQPLIDNAIARARLIAAFIGEFPQLAKSAQTTAAF